MDEAIRRVRTREDSATFSLPFPDPIGDYDTIDVHPARTQYGRGELRHRLDGPSSVAIGLVQWEQDGLPHRLDGPASTRQRYAAITQRYRHVAEPPGRSPNDYGKLQWADAWYYRGVVHRSDGPAFEWADGAREWWHMGQRYRRFLPSVIGANGLREWHSTHDGTLPAAREPDISEVRAIGEGDHYFREVGPSVITGDGLRFWGAGQHVGESYAPPRGPWIEYPDGSVAFADALHPRGANHPDVLSFRRSGRAYVDAVFATPPMGLLGGVGFLPFSDVLHFQNEWSLARVDEQRIFARWALEQWDAVQGNLAHDEERRLGAWLKRFGAVMDSEREEIRLWRQDMKGYLAVALRRLDVIDRRPLESLQITLGDLGLPLTDSVARLTPESRLLRVVATIPSKDVAVPETLTVRNVSDPFNRKRARPAKLRNELYVNGVAEVALAALAAITRSPGSDRADTVLLNLMVDDVDRSTGLDERYCTLSVQVERTRFETLDLERVDPLACVKSLGAAVPRGTTEIAPVRPIIAFDKEDARIVAAQEVASRLDSRANLMELSPNEFESLIQNLFAKIGLDTHQTQASRDGGVDCIAYDSRPIFGGKIVIQAKRYKNTVGVSAVRDLYGTVLNEGASKGLLVTTSGYGKSSYEFAKSKPLELLEGSHLLHLLKEHLNLDAVIVPPVDWVDPIADVREL